MKQLRFGPGWQAPVVGLACWLFVIKLAAADPNTCAVCGQPIGDVVYSYEDKVTQEKTHVCEKCEQGLPDCYVCGVPANTNATGFVRLSDGRALCARDSKTAVLQPEDGLRICQELREGLDRLFSRFTAFPETNVTVGMVDRVHLQELFKLAGNDYQCPDVWGYTQTKTNHNRLEHRISVMTGLPLSWFMATCAHEYSHTWVAEHLSDKRKDQLSRDAEEGFCELVAFLYMDSLHDEAQKALILRNGYTRGQIDLFIAAQKSYGVNEVLDWMQFGTDAQLSASDLNRIRNVSQPRTVAASLPLQLTGYTTPAPPDTLMLKAIFWDKKRPLALINNHAFEPNEEANVPVATTNVLVRCLEISPDSVRVRVAGDSTNLTLRLKAKP